MAGEPTSEGMRSLATRVWNVGRESVRRFSDDHVSLLGAALAFYTVLSIAPVLVMLVFIAGIFFDDASARAAMVSFIEREVGGPQGQTLLQLLEKSRMAADGNTPGVLSGVLMALGATRLFQQLQVGLNRVWHVHTVPIKGMRGIVGRVVLKRSLTFLLLLGIGALFIASVTVGSILPAVARRLDFVPGVYWMSRMGELLISMFLLSAAVGLIYMILPDVRIAWRHVWKGALFTGVLLVLGKLLIGLYLDRQSFENTYGTAGSAVALLIWTYYSAQVFFFGAVLTKVYAEQHGAEMAPEPHARAEPALETHGAPVTA